jgi:hypothetical protein
VIGIGDGHRVGIDIAADNVAHLAQGFAVDVTEQRQRFVGDIQRQFCLRAALASFSPSTLWTSSTIKPIQTLPRIIGIPIFETISMPSENDGAQKTTRIMVKVSQASRRESRSSSAELSALCD